MNNERLGVLGQMELPMEVDATDEDNVTATLVVPSQRVQRLMQLGLAAERAELKRVSARKAQKIARRRNRRK